MKDEVDKLGINQLTIVSTSLNDLKIKVDHLDVGNLKTAPEELKKLSDNINNEVFKNEKFNTGKAKVTDLEK